MSRTFEAELPTPKAHIVQQLAPIHGTEEALIMSGMLLEKITGRTKQELRFLAANDLSSDQQLQLEQMLSELQQHRPIQYVIGEAWFQNMPFYVDERVLIPRPETEELVEWVGADLKNSDPPIILDIGSGSGCIPISLAKKLPRAIIHSCDISADALDVARLNGQNLSVEINWHELDFLDESSWNLLPVPDCLVSNPPYIPAKERTAMSRHVVDFEPSQALFVPDQDPYIFYAAIAEFVRKRCSPGTPVYLELHEDLAAGVCDVLKNSGLTHCSIRTDMQGKQRMLKAY